MRKYYYYYFFFSRRMCGSEEHASRWTAEEVENSVMPPPPPPPLPRKVIRGPSSPLRFAGGILLYAALAQLVSRGLDRSRIHSLLFPRGEYGGRGWFEEFCAELPFIAAGGGGGKRKAEGKFFFGILFHFPSSSA